MSGSVRFDIAVRGTETKLKNKSTRFDELNIFIHFYELLYFTCHKIIFFASLFLSIDNIENTYNLCFKLNLLKIMTEIKNAFIKF